MNGSRARCACSRCGLPRRCLRSSAGRPRLAELAMGVLAEAKARIETLGGDLAQAPAEWRKLQEQTRGALMSGTGRAGLHLPARSCCWSAAAWSGSTGPTPTRRCAADPGDARRHRRARRCASACGAWCSCGSGLLLFTVAAIGASAAFTWPPGVQELVVAATLLLLVLRLAWVAIALVLAPGRAAAAPGAGRARAQRAGSPRR